MQAKANILDASVEIVGSRPLLFNRFGPDAIPLNKSERTGVAGNDPEEWRRRICWDQHRQLVLDVPVIFDWIRDGGRYTKKGRGTLQNAVVAALMIAETVIPIDRYLPEGEVPTDPSCPVYIDARGVRMKSGSWNVRYRIAVSPGWRASFCLTWDRTVLSRRELHAACIDAGRYVGIGDGRKIGFGRFDVAAFEVKDAEDEAAA
jgi:hypothetical protein